MEKGNRWTLVLADHITKWQDALTITDTTVPVVATALGEHVFSYIGLPEQIHSYQRTQFESILTTELSRLWGCR